MSELKIGPQLFSGSNCFIVGEIAQAHDGSLGMAHAFIDVIADAGANAVKFQTHIAQAESTPGEPWRVKFSQQDKTRFDYWRRMEFTEVQWQGLKGHADERGLIFLSSPFSIEAVDLLKRIGMGAWKIASGEVTNTPMFESIAATGWPILLSTGMSPLPEIDEAVKFIRKKDIPFALLQCTSMYPTPPEKVGLNVIPFFQERYHCPVGLSDHSGKIYPALAAATLRAAVIEVHVTFHQKIFGPDVPASVTTEELRQLVEGVRFIEKARSYPVDKDEIAYELAEMRQLFTKSVVARTDLTSGTILQTEHLTVKKPGTGIPAAHLSQIIGRQLAHPLKKDEFLTEEDLA